MLLYDWAYVVFAGIFIGAILLSLRGMYKYSFRDWFITVLWFSVAALSAMHLYGISQETLQDEHFINTMDSWLAGWLVDLLAWLLQALASLLQLAEA